MWIKICANTSLEDAQMAVELGADAVGFVFAPSTRHVTAAQVARITPHLPASVERVGVFPALEAEAIADTVEQAGLNAVQLQGGFDLALVRRLREIFDGQGSRVSLIQTLHWSVDSGDGSAAIVAQQLKEIAGEKFPDRVLIDAKAGPATGGTGVSFDWNASSKTLAEAGPDLKLVVAGGLRPDNVANAILRLNPWGVDVASGVEQSPGRKSPERLAAFIRAARGSAK